MSSKKKKIKTPKYGQTFILLKENTSAGVSALEDIQVELLAFFKLCRILIYYVT